MQVRLKDNKIEILAGEDEEIEVISESVYPDRVIVFRKIESNALQEYHFNSHDGVLLDRAARQLSLPQFEFDFAEHHLTAIVEHRFVDELDFNGYKPAGVDIETITVRVIREGQTVSQINHLHPVNKQPENYFDRANETVERYIEGEQAKKEQYDFLKMTYAAWTTREKAEYHYNSILFQDRMQGGFPSGYTNPAATYLSKWFIDTYSPFDNTVFQTLEQIARLFNIDTRYLAEMVQYETTSSEWKRIANELGLIEK